jgi:hypothetical protein
MDASKRWTARLILTTGRPIHPKSDERLPGSSLQIISVPRDETMNSDYKELLQRFTDHGVRYLIIGGYAYAEYAEPRYTKDLDLWISPDSDNAANVFRALAEFGAPLEGLNPKDFTEEGSFYTMGNPPVRVDVLMSVSGATFEQAWTRRIERPEGGLLLPYVSRDDLIAMKLAAGRYQDLADVENLRLAARRAEEQTLEAEPQTQQQKPQYKLRM